MVKTRFYAPDHEGSNPAISNFLQSEFFLYLHHTISFRITFFSKYIYASIAEWLKTRFYAPDPEGSNPAISTFIQIDVFL